MPKSKKSKATDTPTITQPGKTGEDGTMTWSQPSETSQPGVILPNFQPEVTLMTGQWRQAIESLECKPPCQMTLPPIPFNKPATLIYPHITKSVCRKVGAVVYRYVSTIPVSPVTIDFLELQPLSVIAMVGDQVITTTAADPIYPPGSCSMALPEGDSCKDAPYPMANNDDGGCGLTNEGPVGCPDMQCCGPSGIW